MPPRLVEVQGSWTWAGERKPHNLDIELKVVLATSSGTCKPGFIELNVHHLTWRGVCNPALGSAALFREHLGIDAEAHLDLHAEAGGSVRLHLTVCS